MSQGIAKLENSLNQQLYRMVGRKIKLTDPGKRVLDSSKEIFHSVAKLAEQGVETVEIACMHSFALAVLPKILKKLKRHYPHIHLKFRLGHPDLIREWVLKGMIDFGIVIDNEDYSGFDAYTLLEGEYALYSAKKAVPFEVILSEERSETRRLKDLYRKKNKQELPILEAVLSLFT